MQSLYCLITKLQASSRVLWLYSLVCVEPGRKPRRPVFSQRGSLFDNYHILFQQLFRSLKMMGSGQMRIHAFNIQERRAPNFTPVLIKLKQRRLKFLRQLLKGGRCRRGKNMASLLHIMITCPYDLDPLTPHFYIVKLGFTGVYIIFLFLL